MMYHRFLVLINQRPLRSSRPYNLVPDTTLFRSVRYYLLRWIYRVRRLWPDQSDRREVRAFSLLPRAAAEREGVQWSPRALYLWREGFHRVQGYSTYQPTQQLHSRLSCWISRHRWMRRQRRISDAA